MEEVKIAVIGLGYVGLPLAVEFGRTRGVIAYDINIDRVSSLRNRIDESNQVSADELVDAKYLHLTHDKKDLKDASFYILTVPTPITSSKDPDLSYLISASEIVGSVLNQDDVVVYESTVFPGATEEVCVPILERTSGLFMNEGFFVGYSPERINPGDKEKNLTNIVKITSGSNFETAELVDKVYSSIIHAGTHRAPSIRVAEAAKVIENTQRDLNIALINEVAMIFDLLDINTSDVLEAAATKWNFMNFHPGLVGGHCIGVDPYYLTHKAQSIGYDPEVILAGRRVNDGMPRHIVAKLIRQMVHNNIEPQKSNVLILGLAFKENCPDIRNTKVLDLVSELERFGANVDVYDPVVNFDSAKMTCGSILKEKPTVGIYDSVVVAVPHREFRSWDSRQVRAFTKSPCVVFDLRNIYSESDFLKL